MDFELGSRRKDMWRWALGALAVAVLVACGSDSGGSGGNGGNGNGGSGNGGSGNGGSGNTNGGSSNGGSGNAPSCNEVCDALAECGVDSSQCSGVCGSLPAACASCLVNEGCDSPSCEGPCTDGGNGGSGGDGGNGGNGGGGNGGNGGSDNGGTGNTEDAWGRKCSLILEDCPSSYDCQNTTGNTLDDGICTMPCTSFADCPSFWDCQQVGSGKYCFP